MQIEVPDCEVAPNDLRVQLDTSLTQLFALSHNVTATRCAAAGTEHDVDDIRPLMRVNGTRRYGFWRHATFPGDILVAMISHVDQSAYVVAYRRVEPGTWQASTDMLLVPDEDYPAEWGDEDNAVGQRWARAMLFVALAVLHDRFDGAIPEIVPPSDSD